MVLTGLCGVALTCLIGLAADRNSDSDEFVPIPASIAGAQTEPTERYSRNRESKPSAVVHFRGDFLANGPAEDEAAKPPVNPADSEMPPAQLEFKNERIDAEYKAPEKELPFSVSDVPPEQPDVQFDSESPESQPAAPGNVTLFPAKPPAPAPISLATKAADSPVPATDFAVKPTTGPQTAQVVLEWVKRTEINVGQDCQCDLVVKNAGDVSAQNVVVEASFPQTARLSPTTKPAPTPAGNGQLEWKLGELAAGQTKTIEVHLVPTTREDLNAAAYVHFTTAAATVFPVQEPLLEVALKGPKEVHVGDPASQIIEVSNPGTGTARNVEIKALIPPGLEHPQGKQLSMAIGSLNPGETRMIRLALSAVTGGEHDIKVLAEAKLEPGDAPYLRKLSESQIRIISPSVKVTALGPGLRYKNRNATYDITVANDGTAVSNNVRVMHKVPDGFRFVSATAGGKFDALSKTVAWFVGRIEPGDATEMSVTLEAAELGEFTHQVSAITDQGARSEDQIATQVDGIASLALAVKDLNDPVEVGVETAYEIHVKNSGTKHAQNVAVACELPAGVELVNVEAPAKHNLSGRVVAFQALPALGVDKTAVYRVIVRGQSDGSHRFRARLTSDSIQEPLLVEELTTFYGE